ncbi:MAG: alanine racemase, partial [Firmicutes bacterium]|nr:alanine racemase [Candidatus Caballimonas caccae]
MRNKAIIDLRVIKNNAKTIRKMIGNSNFCAVVKDDAYGHGAVEVASSIYKIVDSYAVSILEEAVELRNVGIDKDILILTPCFFEELERAILYDLTLSVENVKQLKEIKKVCKSLNKKVKVHIQFNSGMNRCGTNSIDEIMNMCKYAKYSKCIYVDGIYSHLGKPENKRALKTQVNNFLLAINAALVYNKNIKTHISASGGVIQNQHFNMVRVGILLYGYKPFKCEINVKPAMKVEVPVIKYVTLKPFSRALYGLKRSFTKKNLALIRLGYGDGLNRKKVHGQFSKKCMDMSLIDKSLIVDNKYIIDDFQKFAKDYHTIPYEIMVN